jgi:hypothetical protein
MSPGAGRRGAETASPTLLGAEDKLRACPLETHTRDLMSDDQEQDDRQHGSGDQGLNGSCPRCTTAPDVRPSRSAARRWQDQRRRDQLLTAGPRESFTVTEIAERDNWICGLCQDITRLVDPSPNAPRALSPSIDHIVAVSEGGAHTRDNVRITHRWCNTERNSGTPPAPDYMRAQLTRLLDGTPIPEALVRSSRPSWQWPASLRIEYMIALYIDAGRISADPRYGQPSTRLTEAADRRSPTNADALIRSGREWIEAVRRRRTPIDARWRAPR